MAECPNVAYAVPAPASLPTDDLIALYAAQFAPQFTAFNLSLSTFPCSSPTFGTYSYLRTCDDCLKAYTDWLCATTLPRCDDIPVAELARANAEAASFNANPVPYNASTVVYSYEPLPDGLQTVLARANASVSRTPWLSPQALAALVAANASVPAGVANQSPIPYGETPPCSSLCYLVAASCPPFFNWQCPLVGKTLPASYGALRVLPDAVTGGGNAGQSANGGGAARGWGRPDDRFGNVFCNALASDVLLAKRTGGASALGAASSRTLVLVLSVVLLVLDALL